MVPRLRGDDSDCGAALRPNNLLMSTLAEPLHQRRTAGDLLPAGMLLVVIVSSVIILGHLGVVLWLAWTSGSPGTPDLTYTTGTFIEVFSDARTYSVLLATFLLAFLSLVLPP